MPSLRQLVAAVAVAALLSALSEPVSARDPGVVLNEIVASNVGGATDADGDTSDWIELHNLGGSAISLEGWILRDSASSWAFPAVTIDSGGYLVVWASGKDRSPTAGELHTDFKLSAGGEYLGLIADDGTVSDEFSPAYPELLSDVSYGLGSSGTLGLMATPSPGRSNQTALSGVAATPTATVGRGIYTSTQTETLTSRTPGAIIRYSTDGKPVTVASPTYTGQITVAAPESGIVTIRARAYADGMLASQEASWSYVFPAATFPNNPETYAGFSSHPVIALYTDDLVNPQDARVQTRFEMIDPDTDLDGFSVPVGVSEFGESSTGFPKNSYRMFFQNEWGLDELEYPLFDDYARGAITPADTFRRLELRGFSWDGPFARLNYPLMGHYLSDRWIKNTVLDAGALAPHGRFVQVFLNGEYWGAYHLRERFDHHFYATYGTGDADDYETGRTGGLRYRTLTNGDGSMMQALWDATDYQSVRDRVDPQSLIVEMLTESLHRGSREREMRVVGASDPAHPDGMMVIANDNDFELGRINFKTGATAVITSEMWNGVARDFEDDPEFKQHLYYYGALAFCPGGTHRGPAMRARLDELIADIEPLMRAEDMRWASGVNGYSRWQSHMARSYSLIDTVDGKHYAGMTAADQLDGCDLRPTVEFADSVLSVTGSPVSMTVAATDPDGDTISFSSATLPPGLAINSTTGVISGTPTTPGTYDTRIRVQDSNDKWLLHDVAWTVTGASGSTRVEAALVLNEYNAVNANSGEWAGTDPAFVNDSTNGGDWIEFVAATQVDLRGWSIELWDRDRSGDLLAMTDKLVLTQHDTLAAVPPGTILTVSEIEPDDLTLSGGDYHINAHSSNHGTSSLITDASRSDFDTNRHDLHVIIRDASGNVVGTAAGETDAWGAVNENVSGAEVMALCATPVDHDPVTDYVDEATTSTFGAANVCAGVAQDLSRLRAGRAGDTDCDGSRTLVDALLIAQYLVGTVSATDDCELIGAGQVYGPATDLTNEGTTEASDTIAALECLVDRASC